MNMDIRQLEQKLQALENDRELSRAEDEIKTLDKEISRLEGKKSEWAEKKREREATIVKERHDIERQIEEAKREQNSSK